MKTIQMRLTVDENGAGVIRLPAGMPPGEYDVVVLIEESSQKPIGMVFSSHDLGPWPDGFSARREEIYDEPGR